MKLNPSLLLCARRIRELGPISHKKREGAERGATHSRGTVKYLRQKMDFAVEFQMYSSEHGLGFLVMLSSQPRKHGRIDSRFKGQSYVCAFLSCVLLIRAAGRCSPNGFNTPPSVCGDLKAPGIAMKCIL